MAQSGGSQWRSQGGSQWSSQGGSQLRSQEVLSDVVRRFSVA